MHAQLDSVVWGIWDGLTRRWRAAKLEMSPAKPGNVARQNRKCRPPKSSPTLRKHIRTRVFAKKCPKSVGRRYRFWRTPKRLGVGRRFPLEMPTLTWRLPSWLSVTPTQKNIFLHDRTTLITICVCHMLSTRIKRKPQTKFFFLHVLCAAHSNIRSGVSLLHNVCQQRDILF